MGARTGGAAHPGSGPAEDGRWLVRVQHEDFDLGAESARLRAGDPRVGAVVGFVGTVRGSEPAPQPGGDRSVVLQALELEHYPGMTERAIETMIESARSRFDLLGATVIHRVGRLAVGEQIVLVVTASAHRQAAFDGCAFLMDWLKTEAPFWKKALTIDGDGRWVEAKASDDAAAARWGVGGGNAASGG